MVFKKKKTTPPNFGPFENAIGKNIFRSMWKPKVHTSSPRLRQIRMRDLTPLIRGEAGWTWTRGRKPQKAGVLAGYGRGGAGTEPLAHPEKLPGSIEISKEVGRSNTACQKEVERLLLTRRM